MVLSVHGSLCIETLNSACSLSAFASTNQFELRTALELKKKILLVHEDDRRRHGCFDFGEKTNGVEWRSNILLRHFLDDKKALTFYLANAGRTRPEYLTRQYAIGSIYRINVYRKWLFLEFEPAYRWRRDNDLASRDGAATFIARLEILFSKDHIH